MFYILLFSKLIKVSNIASTTRRKSRRIDNNDEGDDEKNVSDVEMLNDTDMPAQNVKRKRGRPRKSSTANC